VKLGFRALKIPPGAVVWSAVAVRSDKTAFSFSERRFISYLRLSLK
jgi:hypothetical protein